METYWTIYIIEIQIYVHSPYEVMNDAKTKYYAGSGW